MMNEIGGNMLKYINENILYICSGLNIVYILIIIFTNIKLKRIQKNYTNFMKKLGNGDNINEIIKEFIHKVENLEKKNKDTSLILESLDKRIINCVQKTGLVRYNAFKDTGSDLSFALAILDENDNGIILNGIYSREMSNIFAKQIQNGKSNSKLSNEEEEALNLAISKSRYNNNS